MFITLGTRLQIYWSLKFVTIIWYIQRSNISYRIYYKKVTYLSYKPLSWPCFTLCQLDFGPQFLKLPKVKTFLKNYPVFWTLENSLQPDWMTLWNFFYNSIFFIHVIFSKGWVIHIFCKNQLKLDEAQCS